MSDLETLIAIGLFFGIVITGAACVIAFAICISLANRDKD